LLSPQERHAPTWALLSPQERHAPTWTFLSSQERHVPTWTLLSPANDAKLSANQEEFGIGRILRLESMLIADDLSTFSRM